MVILGVWKPTLPTQSARVFSTKDVREHPLRVMSLSCSLVVSRSLHSEELIHKIVQSYSSCRSTSLVASVATRVTRVPVSVHVCEGGRSLSPKICCCYI